MLFTDEVLWGPGDFLFAALLLGGSGLVFELVLRRSSDTAYRTGAGGPRSGLRAGLEQRRGGLHRLGATPANALRRADRPPARGRCGGTLPGQGTVRHHGPHALAQAAIAVFAFATGQVGTYERPVILAATAILFLLWVASALLFQQAAAREASAGVGSHGSTGPPPGSKVQFLLSLLVVAIGAVLLTFMISVEGELGAVPLLVLSAGCRMVLPYALPIEGTAPEVTDGLLVAALRSDVFEYPAPTCRSPSAYLPSSASAPSSAATAAHGAAQRERPRHPRRRRRRVDRYRGEPEDGPQRRGQADAARLQWASPLHGSSHPPCRTCRGQRSRRCGGFRWSPPRCIHPQGRSFASCCYPLRDLGARSRASLFKKTYAGKAGIQEQTPSPVVPLWKQS